MSPRLAIALLLVTLSGCKPPPNSPAPASTTSAGAGSVVGPGNVIPVGTFPADVMEFGQSQRVTDLAKRKADAIKQDPKWFLEHMQKQKPGEPMTYDPRMGLTPEEYDELQTQSQKTSTRKKADATITIAKGGSDLYVINGGQTLPDLTGITIDLKNGVVRTPLGVTKKHRELSMPDSTPTGAWSGIRWEFETPDANDQQGTTASLAIGKLHSSGRGILIYYVRKLTPPEEKKRVNIMLYYDLPQP